jgi:hypothetical protein
MSEILISRKDPNKGFKNGDLVEKDGEVGYIYGRNHKNDFAVNVCVLTRMNDKDDSLKWQNWNINQIELFHGTITIKSE